MSESTGLSATVALTGVWPFVLLIAAAFSFPVCFFLLSLYRRAVLRGMDASAGVPQADVKPDIRRQPPPAALSILRLSADLPVHAASRAGTLQQAVTGPWKAAMVYAIAGVAYASVMTAGWLLATKDSVVWMKIAVLFLTYYWPAVVAVLIVAAYDRSRRLQVLAAYFIPLVAVMAVAAARNPQLATGALPLYWIMTNVPGFILLVTFMLRPIRAVGPLVLAFMLIVSIGSQAVLAVAASHEPVLRFIAEAGSAIGLSAYGVFFGMILIGIAIFAWPGWLLLRWTGRRYERKKLSDRSIMLDSIWLLFGIVQSIGLAFEGTPWILTGLVAFAAYKLVAMAGFRMLRHRRDFIPQTLLLLRVFRLGKRSEQLFDKLRKHWQEAGSITMIAGPDLASATLEPHDFLEFLSGRIGRQFVSGPADLERKILAADRAPDPDGRYRINEFFCRNDTWQMTMQRLAEMSDSVAMDLRSFSASNEGCLFELGRLLDTVDLRRVLFLVDDTTDGIFLEATLQRLWLDVSMTSPNLRTGTPTVRLFAVRDQTQTALVSLLQNLLAPAPHPLIRHGPVGA